MLSDWPCVAIYYWTDSDDWQNASANAYPSVVVWLDLRLAIWFGDRLYIANFAFVPVFNAGVVSYGHRHGI